MSDLTQQLELQQQITKAISDRSAAIAQQTVAMSKQVEMATKLAAAMNNGKKIDETTSSTRDFSQAIKDVAEQSDEAIDSQQALAAALGDLSDESEKASKTLQDIQRCHCRWL
jgi:protein-disulfide isomerase-like protein with CxxC motif